MDWYEWEPEDVSDYDTEDWGDAELLWGGRSTPRGSALARRLALARRTAPAPARRPVGPVSTAPVPAAIGAQFRQIEHRQRAVASQLAMLQQRTAVQQTSDHFGPLATGAVGALAIGLRDGNTFDPIVTHGLPIAQLLLASRGQAMSAGFRANPWSTLAFPLAAGLLVAFRDQVPGFRQPSRPQVAFMTTDAGRMTLTITGSDGAVLRATRGVVPSSGFQDPNENSPEFPGVTVLERGEALKVRAFSGSRASQILALENPAPRT